MDFNTLIETYGENNSIAALGLLIGCFFGAFAQRSRFCLRSAVIEFWRRNCGEKIAVWLFAFSAAIILTQLFITSGWLDVSQARQLAARGSISGAAIGGLLFGIGMVLARGCASRMLVLAANGNLRALLAGLVFAVAAQSSLNGLLSPLRLAIGSWWTIEGGSSRDLLAVFHLNHVGGMLFGAFWLAAAVYFARRASVSFGQRLAGAGVGVAVAAAWLATYAVASSAFDTVIPIKSLSFTGPSADMLMLVLSPPGRVPDFDSGLVPGVVLGSFVAALLAGELKVEGFRDGLSMPRYIFGAIFMGFGGMLAGGCAVGAGVSGAAVFALTAWVTLATMWLGAGLTDWWVDRRAGTQLLFTAPQP